MKMSNLLTLLKVGADVKLSKEQAQRLADLIEQLQQRIVELERYNVRLANESHEKDLKIDELSVTVERLRFIIETECADEDERIADIQGVLDETPQANLNNIKREVYADGYYDGYAAAWGSDHDCQQDHNNFGLEQSEIESNTKYPSGKDVG